ncbi:MAG: ribonuclease Z, partial [Thermoflexales bacterium]|nr:ribonuclease Z [Thermoflexales bacterium]
MIEVIFLGISSALPMRDSANAAYLVRAGNECILIDCGPAILQQLDAVGISPAEITHVFITHRHADHCLGYPMLMLWYELQLGESKAPPTLLATQFTFDALDTVMATVLGRIAGVTESAPRIVLPQDAPGQAQIHPNILLRTLPMAHSPFAPSIGIRIETRGALGDHAIAFTGDTGPTENVVHLARDADLLVHEATLSVTLTPDQPDGFAGHSTAQRAGMNARAA